VLLQGLGPPGGLPVGVVAGRARAALSTRVVILAKTASISSQCPSWPVRACLATASPRRDRCGTAAAGCPGSGLSPLMCRSRCRGRSTARRGPTSRSTVCLRAAWDRYRTPESYLPASACAILIRGEESVQLVEILQPIVLGVPESSASADVSVNPTGDVVDCHVRPVEPWDSDEEGRDGVGPGGNRWCGPNSSNGGVGSGVCAEVDAQDEKYGRDRAEQS